MTKQELESLNKQMAERIIKKRQASTETNLPKKSSISLQDIPVNLSLSELKVDVASIANLEKVLDDKLSQLVQSVETGLKGIKIDTPVIPQINVPQPKVNVRVPDVIVPPIKIPPFQIPKPEVTVNVPPNKPTDVTVNVPDNLEVSLRGVNRRAPLPVILTDDKGNPYIAGSFGGSRSNSMFLTDSSGRVATIRSLSNNNAVNVSIVDGSGNQITTFGGGTQYNDNATPDQSGGTGTLAMLFDGGSTQSWLGSSYGVGNIQVSGFDGSLVTVTSNKLDVNATQAGTWNIGTVTSITNSLAASMVDSTGIQYSGSNPVPVTGTVTVGSITNSTAATIIDSTGVGYSGSNPVPITGNIGTVTAVTDITNSLKAALIDSTGVQYSGSNPVPVTGTVTVGSITNSTATSLIDSTGVAFEGANPLPVSATQSGTWNVGTVTGITNSLASSLVDSTGIQYSGSNPVPITGNIGTVTTLTGITNSVASALIDSTGVEYSGSNPVPITGNIGTVTTLTGITNSLAASLIDSTGIAFEGANPLPINNAQVGGNATLTGFGVTGTGAQRVVIGSDTTVMVVGFDASRSAATNHPPIQIGAVARQTNPTAYSDGNIANIATDDLGRQLTRPIQMRDLISTAYVTLNSNNETTLKAGTAGEFTDLIYIMAVNTSSNAIFIDIRSGTGGAVVQTVGVPAGGTSGVAGATPYPQIEVAQAWTVQYNSSTGTDLSNTTSYVTAQFSREI